MLRRLHNPRPSKIAVYYAHADMRELEQLLESHLFLRFSSHDTHTHPPPFTAYLLSRLPMLTIDDDVCRNVWNGKIAIQITLDPVEAAGKETEPIYVMLDTPPPTPFMRSPTANAH